MKWNKIHTSLTTILKLKKLPLLLVIATLGESLALAQNPVWLYKPGETEPTGSYATISTAVSALNTLKIDNCIVELHGDTQETASIAPKYSVTFRSEKGANHTVTFKIKKTGNAFAFQDAAIANKVFTFGDGKEYGILTIDMNNSGRAIILQNGTVNILDGAEFINGNIDGNNGGAIITTGGNSATLNVNGGVFSNNTATGNGGAICVTSKTKINVNGGRFESNTANYGGAIAIIPYKSSTTTINSASINLNGGCFIGNGSRETSTTDIYPYGNAIYYNTSGDFTIGGTLQFGENQDIYLADGKEMKKESAITLSDGKPIPVTLGTKNKDVLEYRNLLSSKTETVVSSDLAKFTLANDADYLKSMYLGLSFAETDKSIDNTGSKESPVLELGTHFESNMENFINNDFTPVEPYKGSKTAIWLDEDKKDSAEITIDEQSSELPILILGSLCGAHGLTSDMIKNVINKSAEYYNVEYYFASQTAGGGSQFKIYEEGKPIAGKERIWGPKTLERGKKITAASAVYSGAHDLGNYIASYLVKRLQEQRYSKILFMFDNASITSSSYDAYKPEEQVAFYKAANLLKEYYAHNQVIWISSGTKVGWSDYDGTGHSGSVTTDKLLIQGHYTDDTSLYHYATTPVKYIEGEKGTVAKYDKFNCFFVMGLMDPATWLEGVKNRIVPKWEDYKLRTFKLRC